MTKSKVILLMAFIVYSISAIFNNGFYYFDEHYQLIEFAELKSGNNKPSDLAWEYNAKIRSAVQPAMAYVFLSFARIGHITDPYILMICLRIFTALLAMAVITYFIKKTDYLIQENLKIWYKLLSYFVWFIPFINVRFSSESYSGLAFMLGVSLLFSNKQHKYVLVGCLLGLSFLFRFQTAFMSFGLMLWLIFINKTNLNNLIKILIGGAFILIVGFAIDYWFYGKPTVTFINYYVANVVNDVASAYGVTPWYFYFTEAVNAAIAPIGVVIWASMLIQLIFNTKGLISWIVVPFLLVHIIVPHKELRFLFPILNIIPLAIVLSLQAIHGSFFSDKKETWVIIVLAALFILNSTVLLVTMLSPADEGGRSNITQEIHLNYKSRKVRLLIVDGDNPYRPLPLSEHFYQDKNVKQLKLNLFKPIQFGSGLSNLLVIRTDRTNYYQPLFEPYKLVRVKAGIPDWISDIKTAIGYKNHTLLLYQVEPK